MNIKRFLILAAVATCISGPAFADGASSSGIVVDPPVKKPVNHYGAGYETQRDINQQKRIDGGLDSGALNTREAAKLEHGQSRLDFVEAKDMKDGSLSKKDRYQIKNMENRQSKMIYGQKHDAQYGNPKSLSSRRMQRDVQRNVWQEKRLKRGMKNGQIGKGEYSRLQRNQAGLTRREFKNGRNGRIGRHEQMGSRQGFNHNSRRIHHFRKNG
ncbi:MAG: hypothetical protein GC185_09585 [Alphaproteobacteria bacterium]|nr:hypothetical protein [Alphaproteobacteria bacterium]